MSKEIQNHMNLTFDARSVNEGFARMVVAAFMMEMDPTMEELADVKTAVSEAVTNAIIHGCAPLVEMECTRSNRRLVVSVRDHGVGIADIEKARQPFYSGSPDRKRSGMGFSFMEAFMDEVQVTSAPGKGTCVTMTKSMGENE